MKSTDSDYIIDLLEKTFPEHPMPAEVLNERGYRFPDEGADVTDLFFGKTWRQVMLPIPEVDGEWHETPGALYVNMTDEAITYYFPALMKYVLSKTLSDPEYMIPEMIDSHLSNDNGSAINTVYKMNSEQKRVVALYVQKFAGSEWRRSAYYKRLLQTYWGQYLNSDDIA